jgi:hypothetical protein
MTLKRRRELKPLSSEHEQALLVAFQLKKGVAGHGESAGAPKDLPGLLALARRYEATVLTPHTRAEEELFGALLKPSDQQRLEAEHAQLRRYLDDARQGGEAAVRTALARFADLLERHVRWEEREVLPAVEARLDEAALADMGHELEKRLVLAHGGDRTQRRV